MTDTAQMQKLRACGRLETYSTARHHLGFYNNVGLAATYNSNHPISASLETVVFAALAKVIRKHPNLSAIPQNEAKSYPDVYFAKLSSIDLRTCVVFHEREFPVPKDGEADGELDQLLAEQHNCGFKVDHAGGMTPFWRLAILATTNDATSFTAVWIWHHALADGTSALLFHDTLRTALNALPSNLDLNISTTVASSETPLPPAFEDQHPMSLTWSRFFKAICTSFFPSVFHRRPSCFWTGNAIQTHATPLPRFKYRSFAISAAATKRLAQLSRKENVTVTATLQTLLAASLFANLPTADFDKVRIVGPMAMRALLKNVERDQMTNATTQYIFMHHRPNPPTTTTEGPSVLQYFTWDEARAVKRAITREAAKKGADNNVALLKYVLDMHALFTDDLGKARADSAELSNIGVYRPQVGEGEWNIGRMTFSQCANVTGCAFGVNVVTGGDGNASVGFCWCEGGVEEGLVGTVIEVLEEGIKDWLGMGKC
jgi:hypothetical protein